MDNQNQPQNPFFPPEGQDQTAQPTPQVNETPLTPATNPDPLTPPVLSPVDTPPVSTTPTNPTPFVAPEPPTTTPGGIFGVAPTTEPIPADQSPVAPTPAGKSGPKKWVLRVSIVGGVIVVAAGGYFGLTAYANVVASNYAKSLYSTVESSSLKKDDEALLSSSSDISTIEDATKASNTFSDDVLKLQKSLPSLGAAPFGSLLSSNYKSASQLQTKAKTFITTTSATAADLKDYIAIANVANTLEEAYLKDADSGNAAAVQKDFDTNIANLKALKVGNDLKPLQNATVTYFSQVSNEIRDLAAGKDYSSITQPDEDAFDKASDDAETMFNKKSDTIVSQGNEIDSLAQKIK